MLDDDYLATLPVTRFHSAKNDKDETIYYTELIDYEFADGTLNFYVTNSDFFVDERPAAMNFKVVVHYY